MTTDGTRPTIAHPVRGAVVTLVLGVPMLVSGAVAALSLLDAFLTGLIPTKWFSGNAADWWLSFGLEGGASNYVRFMAGAMLAYLCYSAIVWGFTGRARSPSR